MDETQRLDYNEDEEETSAIRDRPVGNLHMFAGIHGPAQDFPIHRGQNIIGRHASCDITLPAQSVSKKHAILQVRGNCHTICDNDSLNKTRRAKIPLAPNVHYALSNGDFLLFADVACRYTIKETVELETTAIEDSEDDSVLVPATQGALAIEKTPGAAIRRIARGAVLARDSGDEDEDEEQTRSDGGCGSVKDGHKTSGPGTIFPPGADTIVPESDEENDTSTSESQLPSLNLQCDSDTDTSRRSSFVPSSQNISTPLALKDQSKNDGRTLTAGDKEAESRKPSDTEVKLKLAVEDTTDGKETPEEQVVESMSGGGTSEPCVVISGTADEKLKEEQECARMLQDDATKKPSSENMAVSSACVVEDKVASSRSEAVQETPCEPNTDGDAVIQQHYIEPKKDNVGFDSESSIQEKDTTTSDMDGNTAETSAIQSSKTEEGNSRSSGSVGAVFHMDSDTDADDDEAVSTGSDLEKAKTPQAADTEKSENNVIEPASGRSEGNSDSDTDVEGDQSDLKSESGNDEVKNKMGEPSKTEGTAALGSDSDTDDVDLPKPNESKAEQESRGNPEEKKEGFHLDSDTDVEEDVSIAEVRESKADVKETNDAFNLDSDTDVDEDTDVPGRAVTGGPQDSFTENVQEVSEVKDTDVNEDDQIPEGSNVNQGKLSNDEQKEKTAVSDVSKSEEAAALYVDSDTDVDDDASMSEKVGAPEDTTDTDGAKVGTEMIKEAAALHVDSDTDVDDDASMSEKVGAPESTVRTDSAKVGTEMIKKAAALQVDSDTDVDDDSSVSDKVGPPEDTAQNDGAKVGTEMTKEAAAPHVDSDTDVDDDASMLEKMGAPEETAHNEGAKVGTEMTKEAAVVQVDSDTDVDDDASVSEKIGAHEDTAQNDGAKVGTEITKGAAALQVDSDTDDDDDASMSKKVGAPESTAHTDRAKVGTEMTKEAADLHLDSDTDVEEDKATVEDKVDTSGGQEESGVEDLNSFVSSANESAAISCEETKNVPEEIGVDEDETQKSETENIDLEMMPTQSYLEQQEESDLQDEEEATQAFILSSTWAEPDPFKRPADPISVLQISSVTLNASEEDIDENAIAETQDFCTETEPRGPSVLETPEPVRRSEQKTIQSSSNSEESGTEVQQLSHEVMSPDATQPVSQDLSARPPQDTGTWLHLKRDVPATVWLRGIQQEGDSTDLEGDQETTQEATQAEEQSLNLALEATQSNVAESLSVEESPVKTAIPTHRDTAEPDAPPEKIEPPCSEEATDDATQPYSLRVPDSENASTQACNVSEETTGDGDTRAVSIDSVPTEDDSTQVADPSIPAAEEEVPEISTSNEEKLSSRRGLSRSKRKKEPAHTAPQTSLETEEHPDKASVSPGSLTEEADELGTGEPQLESEPEVEVEKEVRRLGRRRIAESASKTAAKEEVLVTTTSRKRTGKISSETEPSTSGISEQRGRKQVSRKSAIKVANEVLKVEQELSTSNEELKSFAPENALKAIEGLTSEDKKGSPVEQISKDQASSDNKDILRMDPSTSSTVTESEELTESNDNSATNLNKKTPRNRRRVATRLRNETESTNNVEKDNNENVEDDNSRMLQEKESSKPASESLHSEKVREEESQVRKGTRRSRLKSSEQESDKAEDPAARVTEKKKKSEEVCPADSVSENVKSRQTRRSLKEETKEESENLQEGRAKTRRGANVKDSKPQSKPKENVEELPEKTPQTTRNNSKAGTTKPEQEVKEEVKTEDVEVVRKSRRTQKNLKEEQKSEETSGTRETSSNDSPAPRRTRGEQRGEDGIEKEEAVKETTSRRTRRHSKEEEAVKLEEDQIKKPRRTRKDSKEETKTKETSEESFIEEDKEEKVGRTSTRKTRKNVKDDEKPSVQEKKSKATEENAKPERSSRSRAKASDESTESHVEEDKKGTEESPKLSPQEEKPRPAVGRGRRAAKKDDLPPVSTPVASRKRGQATKAEAEGKRKKSDEDVNQEVLGEVETPKSRRGRPRKLATESENTQTVKESSPPDPSPSRSTRQRPSSARSSPVEAKTPRRTNRMASATAASPYAAQSGATPKILFTGVVDTVGEETIRSLGGEIADSVFDCTHLVTDRVRRTVKFLCALARGIPIVTLDWIDKCKKSKCFLSPIGFLVNDKEHEKNFNFLLSESLQKAKKRPLFEGYEIHVTANVKPEPEHMKDLIRCSGATFLPKMPRSFKEKCIVVSCPEDAARCKSVPVTVPVTSAEFILGGILRQEVNPTAHLLNPAAPDSVPTPAKRRR